MDLPINDKDLATIVNALALGGDARLYHLLKEVKYHCGIFHNMKQSSPIPTI